MVGNHFFPFPFVCFSVFSHGVFRHLRWNLSLHSWLVLLFRRVSDSLISCISSVEAIWQTAEDINQTFCLTDNEKDSVVISAEEIHPTLLQGQFCLVGKIIAERRINHEAFKTNMTKVWKFLLAFTITGVGDNLEMRSLVLATISILLVAIYLGSMLWHTRRSYLLINTSFLLCWSLSMWFSVFGTIDMLL